MRKIDDKNVYVDFADRKIEGVMLPQDQSPTETYAPKDVIKVFVRRVKNGGRNSQVLVSRTAPGLVKKLFEQQVPEIAQGIVEIKAVSAEGSAETQISQIEQCVSEGYDAILFEPVDPDGLADAAKSAADSGVVMINIISACTDWQNNGISAVSYGNNVKAGETEMEQVAKLLNGKGNIAILTGPSGDAGGLQRMEGYENILKNYPEIKQVVAPADCQWDTASAQSTVESWLSAYDLDAIVCENDGMAVGAGNAAGANSGIVIAGVDGTPDGFEAIQDGRISGTVSQNGGAMAANGIEAAVKLLKGETLDTTEIVTDNTWIDSSNVKDYE